MTAYELRREHVEIRGCEKGLLHLADNREQIFPPLWIKLCHDLIQHPEGKTSRLIRQIRYGCPYFPLEGHCPRFEGWELAQILMSGVNSDHTDQSLSGLKQRIENGMFVQLQDKTLKPEFLQYLKENQLFEHFALVTDDTMPDAFMKRGQLNYLVKKAMHLGLTPEQAIYVSTFTPARRMGLRDKGSIAPGKIADFVILLYKS